MKKIIKSILGGLGYVIAKKPKIQPDSHLADISSADIPSAYVDISNEVWNIFRECQPYTLLSVERIDSIVSSVDYLCKNKAFVYENKVNF